MRRALAIALSCAALGCGRSEIDFEEGAFEPSGDAAAFADGPSSVGAAGDDGSSGAATPDGSPPASSGGGSSGGGGGGQSCSPADCTGCCVGEICAQGNQDIACGAGGVTCAVCAAGQSCVSSGCR